MPRFENQIQWISTQQDAMCERVKTWSSINTGTFNTEGISKLTDQIRPLFESLGATSQLAKLRPYESIDDRGQTILRPLADALVLRIRPELATRALLAIHLDTVYGRDHPFQTVDSSRPGILRGPGVSDAKGGIAVMLTALQALEQSPQARQIGWTVILNTDEEIGSPGSTPLLIREASEHQVGLVFEPALADGGMVGARKGSGNFTLVVHGRSAHAGRDIRAGRNAIHALADAIILLRTLADDHPDVTLNVGHIAGGGPVNVVPDLALCRFNLRIPDSSSQRWIEQELHELVAHLNSLEGFAARLHGTFTAPPKPLSVGMENLIGAFNQCATDLGFALTWTPTGGVCDGNRLAAAGLPTVDTLGPRGGNLHSDQEFLLTDSLTQRAKLTSLFLLRLANGEWVPPPRTVPSSKAIEHVDHGRSIPQ